MGRASTCGRHIYGRKVHRPAVDIYTPKRPPEGPIPGPAEEQVAIPITWKLIASALRKQMPSLSQRRIMAALAWDGPMNGYRLAERTGMKTSRVYHEVNEARFLGGGYLSVAERARAKQTIKTYDITEIGLYYMIICCSEFEGLKSRRKKVGSGGEGLDIIFDPGRPEEGRHFLQDARAPGKLIPTVKSKVDRLISMRTSWPQTWPQNLPEGSPFFMATPTMSMFQVALTAWSDMPLLTHAHIYWAEPQSLDDFLLHALVRYHIYSLAESFSTGEAVLGTLRARLEMARTGEEKKAAAEILAETKEEYEKKREAREADIVCLAEAGEPFRQMIGEEMNREMKTSRFVSQSLTSIQSKLKAVNSSQA